MNSTDGQSVRAKETVKTDVSLVNFYVVGASTIQLKYGRINHCVYQGTYNFRFVYFGNYKRYQHQTS